MRSLDDDAELESGGCISVADLATILGTDAVSVLWVARQQGLPETELDLRRARALAAAWLSLPAPEPLTGRPVPGDVEEAYAAFERTFAEQGSVDSPPGPQEGAWRLRVDALVVHLPPASMNPIVRHLIESGALRAAYLSALVPATHPLAQDESLPHPFELDESA